ncbi:hypothetical protein [Paraglaciecola hydrolytica]|uniref:Uncharacterized protein n=1 Tax=Paraglaciecola hydrolytica TaxID=1799789 RepID=A0A136A5B9_9ALTE|nr:hypothetical protein [Paraglaciecola hydrolytica]KXI30423.1 hypothetical protein AX660_10690 [Paraglaciecola hydrolytica]
MTTVFPVGSVAHTLMQLRGTWHDSVELFNLDGSPLIDDTQAGSGTPGLSPFDNIVYIDFDGLNFKITNVHFRGRPALAKTFTGKLVDGLLVFDPMGPGSYENVGMSGGPGILTFTARQLNQATNVYMEPDFIIVTAPGHRTRHTVLYRNGQATRTLTAKGVRLSPSCTKRHELDPRGLVGDVHEAQFQASIWQHLV